MPAARLLGQEARLVIPDLLGFGSSPKPPVEYTVEEHLRWLDPLFSSDGEWTVVGHSMGCVLAARSATRWTARVRSVVLFNAPAFVSPESRRERLSRHNLLTRVSTWSPVAGRVICEASCLSRPLLTRLAPLWRRELPRDVVRDYFRHTWNSYESSLRHLVVERDLVADLAEVPVPLLVVQGSDDGLADPPSAVRWPSSVRVESVAGADHTALLLPDGSGVAAVLRRVLATKRGRAQTHRG
jgi:pimeloyl-ACP methyl ester carboxylesterase